MSTGAANDQTTNLFFEPAVSRPRWTVVQPRTPDIAGVPPGSMDMDTPIGDAVWEEIMRRRSEPTVPPVDRGTSSS